MLPVLLSALMMTTPPLVQAPEERAPLVQAPGKLPPYPQAPTAPYAYPGLTRVRQAPPPPAPLADATLGLFFAPLSLFSLSFWLEGDLALVGGLDLFANVGGGPLGQFGFDVGLRYYVQGRSLEGFFVDLRGSVFSMPASELWMAGPGLMIGHGWRIKRFTLSIALGATTWYGVNRGSVGTVALLGLPLTDAEVIIFPGVTQPPNDRPGVQPTVRVSLGPWF
ncbi:MAG: hypothetical protein Q8L48_17735 [Archangium sp.]|nr:hypothetical protein [Archangium sp.]